MMDIVNEPGCSGRDGERERERALRRAEANRGCFSAAVRVCRCSDLGRIVAARRRKRQHVRRVAARHHRGGPDPRSVSPPVPVRPQSNFHENLPICMSAAFDSPHRDGGGNDPRDISGTREVVISSRNTGAVQTVQHCLLLLSAIGLFVCSVLCYLSFICLCEVITVREPTEAAPPRHSRTFMRIYRTASAFDWALGDKSLLGASLRAGSVLRLVVCASITSALDLSMIH